MARQKLPSIANVRSAVDLAALRQRLKKSAAQTRAVLEGVSKDENALFRLKFERLGCHPLHAQVKQHVIEQINQQATFEVAVEALEILMARHPALEWVFGPGAEGVGHDLRSTDGSVAGEVFAAAKPSANGKLEDDLARLKHFNGRKYIFYRCPRCAKGETDSGGVTVVSLGG